MPILRGMGEKEIAELMALSPRTIRRNRRKAKDEPSQTRPHENARRLQSLSHD